MRTDGLVVGIQDMGAAGLTCSTCETASRGGTGNEIDLDLVPKRETGMSAYEIMLSESQERMLLIANKGREKEVEEIFAKWDLHGVTIGKVTDDGMMRVKVGKKTVAEIPADKLANDAPIYYREAKQPDWEIENRKMPRLPEPKDYEKTLLGLLKSPTIASKNWVYRQYDHMVQDGTIVAPGSDAAVIRINLDRPDLGYKGAGAKHLAFTTDCNSTYCYLDPYEGGKTAVAEAYRNLVCSGAKPLAVTDNLNFGNPMDPHIFWQFRKCVEGVSEACAFFNTPVTGGNVSFYNESPVAAIDPTPTIGMLGLIDDPKHITTQWFKDAGDVVLLLGDLGAELGGSEYLKRIHKLKKGAPPRMDMRYAKKISDGLLKLIRKGWVKSAHDCSEGGIAVALAECCMSGGDAMLGATIKLPVSAAALFGETQSRIVVTATPENAKKILASGLPVKKLGVVGGDKLRIGKLSWDVAKLRAAWWNAIGRLMGD
jgi:phosphoribosylformylglycinamidine synthase